MQLKIISFNIRCCDDKHRNSIAQRAPRLAAITLRYDADILCLQEVRPKWVPHLDKYYGKEYDMFLKYRNETVDIEASPILWRRDRFEAVSKGYFWLSDTPETESRGWDEVYNCYRICEYVILKEKESGDSFTVMNTHFGFGDSGQVKSARLIYDYSKKISDHKTLVTGDFNMTPDSAGYAEMTKNFKDVNVCTVNDKRTTFHNYKPDTVKDKHIDYCFIDEKITPVSYKIITDTVWGKYPSDHFGLYIQLNM
ncbi:MAG: endonuclease/exonuclease/phosphatase family protein [Clostridia bacterium]|nr:endonuclease/exonuclease/phosphatase family protein [Clostridia bacterium]